ncbi:hypothetical protein I308_104138 [Cryptococcus tetragattii IND107]|uniref:Uncharacterized protein n=1 Tax=Cryptococcus tetragattii IND107 TaxID=1296105 RepID=A0ABR3BPK2_9TREE
MPLFRPRGKKVVTSAVIPHSTLNAGNAASTFRSFLPAACMASFLPSPLLPPCSRVVFFLSSFHKYTNRQSATFPEIRLLQTLSGTLYLSLNTTVTIRGSEYIITTPYFLSSFLLPSLS